MRQYTRYLFILIPLFFSCYVFASNKIQTSPIVISQSLINAIHQLKPDSSNSSRIEKKLGPPSACLPVNEAQEAWVCQWKGNMTSAGVVNTLNIWFEAGMMTSIVAIDKSGNYLTSPQQ